MKDEPVITVASIATLVGAVLALLRYFNIIHLTDEAVIQILAFVGLVAPIVLALIARHFTFPAGHVAAYQTASGVVVAGDASPITTGTPVDVEANGNVGVADPEEEDAGPFDD